MPTPRGGTEGREEALEVHDSFRRVTAIKETSPLKEISVVQALDATRNQERHCKEEQKPGVGPVFRD
jgi:hypothetical protein